MLVPRSATEKPASIQRFMSARTTSFCRGLESNPGLAECVGITEITIRKAELCKPNDRLSGVRAVDSVLGLEWSARRFVISLS
jgi:hypothetical protein